MIPRGLRAAPLCCREGFCGARLGVRNGELWGLASGTAGASPDSPLRAADPVLPAGFLPLQIEIAMSSSRYERLYTRRTMKLLLCHLQLVLLGFLAFTSRCNDEQQLSVPLPTAASVWTGLALWTSRTRFHTSC